MRSGADFTKSDLDKLNNSQLVTMSRQEARDAIDFMSDEHEEFMSALDNAQGEVENGGVTFVVIRVEG